jgi:hypothetical protein
MQLIAQEISIHALTPYDGSTSAAIKVVHRTLRDEATNDDTASQKENLRRAVRQLIQSMNPNPEHITIPSLVIFDSVRVQLPNSHHDGQIKKIAWDFTRREWKYFVACHRRVVSAWYELADLQSLEDE